MAKLVIVEGIDGSGKTTLAKILCDVLNNSIFLNKKSTDATTTFQK
ncbi:MAG: hypothetical protein LBJ84_01875, partial [Oscillospiraceae bacterium]|nr:hypothetical protein [Oscillospiraceae bacterium]